jgi:RsiW-degrading membrane proteinase PrsW (M82 family)
LKQEKLEVWHLYNVILIISVPFGMLVYLKFWNTNYKWHKTKQCVLL